MAKATKFDRDEVVDKATNLYWEKGYHGTSMRNLQEVIDMRPGSIYASFGSKEGLFKEALQNYADIGLEELCACELKTDSPLGAIQLFMKNNLDNSEGVPNGMCMLVKTVSELTSENAELLAEAKKLLRDIESAITALLIKAQQADEIDAKADPSRLAGYLQVQLMGLRAYMRATDDKERVDEIVTQIFAGEFFKTPS